MSNRMVNRSMKFNPLFIVVGILLLIAIFRNTTNGVATSAPITMNWNLQDLDVTKNGNALRALLFLETNKFPAPTSPSPSTVLSKPSKFYGQYLQFSGTIMSARSFSPQSNLETIIIGNSTEIILKTNDDTTIIDCFLVGSNQVLTPGSTITVYGYSPGIRYIQNTQGRITSELALIGHFKPPSSISDGSLNSTLPISPSIFSPISPNPS